MRKKRGLSCKCPHLQQDSDLTSLLLTVGTQQTPAGTCPHAQLNSLCPQEALLWDMETVGSAKGRQ